ncbi:MAG: hypothetical protein FWC70_07055 [Defluviitaleaceae bacterium]|nr:hypothetical protein [Defluviitaleaceae bacterium]
MRNKITGTIAAVAILLTACGNTASEQDYYRNIPFGETFQSDSADTPENDYVPTNAMIIGDYCYPENPAEELRAALADDFNYRNLPMTISEVENVEFGNTTYSQITINFTDSENIGLVFFRNTMHDFDFYFDDRPNPSFNIAFKNHENTHDKIMLLTSVFLYLSPDISPAEAERMAINQDRTISTDGFSQPLDIGGYQVQSRYTNPFAFIETPEFTAKSGISVRAIGQLWNGAFYVGNARQLNRENYHLLNSSFWVDDGHPAVVYGDFIVLDTSRHITWQHGSTSVTLEAESMSGERFTFSLNTTRWFRNPYEFGVGQRYTIFFGLEFRQGIVYAIQRSESENFNIRGQEQSIDALSMDFIDAVRVWPDDDEETLPEVSFMTYAFGPLNVFPAREGHGLGGDIAWPTEQFNPLRADYIFHGWFDNPDFDGAPFTNETIIFQDTMLFPKWVYSGPGGIAPRAYRGAIIGLGDSGMSGSTLEITALGYNTCVESPWEKRFRWIPVAWRLSDDASGNFTNEAPFFASIPLRNAGEHGLYITYTEEVFDRVRWQQTGQVREVRERLLTVR